MAVDVVDGVPRTAEEAAVAILSRLALVRCGLDARVVEAAGVIVAAAGAALLTVREVSSVEELSPSAVRTWRAETKRAAALEVEVALGVGIEESRDLVAVACAPAAPKRLLIEAMDRGEATWSQARAAWRECRGLVEEEYLLVLEALFGTESATAHPDRLDPDGGLHGRPWPKGRFYRALEGEMCRVRGKDVAAERARRQAAYQARRVGLEARDDGTGVLTVTGPLATLCAIHTRMDRAARLLRRKSDTRTLEQLRADIILALLLHGNLPLPEGDDDELSPQAMDAITMVMNALPAVQLQVIVPWDTITQTPCCPHGHDHGRKEGHDRDEESEVGGEAAGQSRARPDADGELDDDQDSFAAEDPVPEDPVTEDCHPEHRRRGGTAMVVGARTFAITPGHARELALTPDTTIFRLLTDQADGRLIERSVKPYQPDPDMRRQIFAADRFSRDPVGTRPAHLGEIDHVVPWKEDDAGGPTSEANLAALALNIHQVKTSGWWRSAINTRRDLTWTTLLGQVIDTRVYDYRHHLDLDLADRGPTTRPTTLPDLLALLRGRLDALGDAEADGDGEAAEPSEARRDLLNRAFYAVLTHRGPDAFLAADDDDPADDDNPGPVPAAGWLFQSHTDDAGRRRDGGHPDTPTPEDLLHLRTDDREPRRRADDGDPQLESHEHADPQPGPATPWSRPRADEPPPF